MYCIDEDVTNDEEIIYIYFEVNDDTGMSSLVMGSSLDEFRQPIARTAWKRIDYDNLGRVNRSFLRSQLIELARNLPANTSPYWESPNDKFGIGAGIHWRSREGPPVKYQIVRDDLI